MITLTTPEKGQTFNRKNSKAKITIISVSAGLATVKGLNSGEIWSISYSELFNRYTLSE